MGPVGWGPCRHAPRGAQLGSTGGSRRSHSARFRGQRTFRWEEQTPQEAQPDERGCQRREPGRLPEIHREVTNPTQPDLFDTAHHLRWDRPHVCRAVAVTLGVDAASGNGRDPMSYEIGSGGVPGGDDVALLEVLRGGR